MADHPYSGLPADAFWRTGVAEAAKDWPNRLGAPKFPISRELPILTAGSCFAQHLTRLLRDRKFALIDAEPVPDKIPEALANEYGYRLFSARTGNIYTLRQFRQLIEEALGRFQPADPVWQRDGRFYDALRPGVEPEGLESADQVLLARAAHLDAFRGALKDAGLIVFTLGLTEAWTDRASGTVYPTAPGTFAGEFDPDRHALVQFRLKDILADFAAIRRLLKRYGAPKKVLLTVSPVPLTATASGRHVLMATSEAKAALRTACAEICAIDPDADYFPSYEIVANPASQGRYFEANMRSVSRVGVRVVMRSFLATYGDPEAADEPLPVPDDVECEEELLDAYTA